MRENVGGIDRWARIVVGPGLVAAALTVLGAREGRWLGLGTLVAGALITDTFFTRVCPVNELLHIDTARGALAR
jgi:hypothetical protein